MNNFSNVLVDQDTRIISESEIIINDIPALNQQWNWDGIIANSLIFNSIDVEKFTDDELLKMIKKSGIQVNSSVTYSNKDSYRFVNFNFSVS